MKHMDIVDLQWIVFISLWSCGHLEIICPDVAELASTVQLTCTFPGPVLVIYVKTEWEPGKSLTVTCPKSAMTCINNPDEERINGTVVNATHSFLEIRETKRTDAGDWFCEARGVTTSNCSLVLRKSPSCDINSDRNTNNLLVGEDLTLTVGITGYYCSVPVDFILKTGDTTEYLKMNESVADIESDVINFTFTISDSHIGSLGLWFSCNNIIKRLACGGVETLLRKLPLCYITSNKDTDELDVGEDLSVSVYIEAYSCPRNTKYKLQIGTVIMDLSRSSAAVYTETVTFIVTESHFGPVRLKLTCNDITRDVRPRGIDMLLQRPVQEEAQFPYLGIGVGIGVAVMLLLGGICILGIYLKRRAGKIQDLSDNHYDGLQGRNEDARFGYGGLTPQGDDSINPTEDYNTEYIKKFIDRFISTGISVVSECNIMSRDGTAVYPI